MDWTGLHNQMELWKQETFSLLIPDAKGPGSGAVFRRSRGIERLRADNPTFF